MKFGASVWPFKWDSPYDSGIKRIAGLGFKAVELIAWDKTALDEYYTPQTVKHLKNMLDDEGLLLSEFVSTPKGMASPDKGDRDAAVEHFKRAVEVGVALGTGIMNSVASYPFEIPAPHITVLPHVQVFQVDYPPGLDLARPVECATCYSARSATGSPPARGLPSSSALGAGASGSASAAQIVEP